MNFREYIQNLSPEELQSYAINSGTTVSYIKTHLFYGYKEPRKNLRNALVKASNGAITEVDVLRHFGFITPLKFNTKDNISLNKSVVVQ